MTSAETARQTAMLKGTAADEAVQTAREGVETATRALERAERDETQSYNDLVTAKAGDPEFQFNLKMATQGVADAKRDLNDKEQTLADKAKSRDEAIATTTKMFSEHKDQIHFVNEEIDALKKKYPELAAVYEKYKITAGSITPTINLPKDPVKIPGVIDLRGVYVPGTVSEGLLGGIASILTTPNAGPPKEDQWIPLDGLPRKASGGIVPSQSGGQPVVVGEGGEAEAILPLSKLSAMLDFKPTSSQGGGDLAVLIGLLNELIMRLPDGSGGDTNVTVHVNGSVTTSRDLAEMVRSELLKTGKRNSGVGF